MLISDDHFIVIHLFSFFLLGVCKLNSKQNCLLDSKLCQLVEDSYAVFLWV